MPNSGKNVISVKNISAWVDDLRMLGRTRGPRTMSGSEVGLREVPKQTVGDAQMVQEARETRGPAFPIRNGVDGRPWASLWLGALITNLGERASGLE